MARIQKLPPIFWLINSTGIVPLNDKHTYVWHWKNGVKTPVLIKGTPEKSAQDIAKEQIERAQSKGCPAYASTYIPCNGQHGVFMFSAAGCTKEYALAKNVSDSIDQAYASVFSKVETKPSKKEAYVQTIVEDECVEDEYIEDVAAFRAMKDCCSYGGHDYPVSVDGYEPDPEEVIDVVENEYCDDLPE